MNIDHYKILGVDKNCTNNELKKEYRRLMKKHHPDMNNGQYSQIALDIISSYKILSDNESKRIYDETLRKKKRSGSYVYVNDEINNILFRKSDIKKLHDINISMTINNTDTIKSIRYARNERCTECNGIGYEKYTICRSCNGTGTAGLINIRKCNMCNGDGILNMSNMCNICNGTGIINIMELINIEIPKNTNSNECITYKGYGNYKRLFGYADLNITFTYTENDYTINGNDININIYLSISDMYYGTKTQINHPDGTLMIKIPPRIQSGKTLRVSGKGTNSNGDLLMQIFCYVPQELNSREMAMMEHIYNGKMFIKN